MRRGATSPKDADAHVIVADHEIDVSGHPEDFGGPVASGALASTLVERGPAEGRYLHFVALSQIDGQGWASIAALHLQGTAREARGPCGSFADIPSSCLCWVAGYRSLGSFPCGRQPPACLSPGRDGESAHGPSRLAADRGMLCVNRVILVTRRPVAKD